MKRETEILIDRLHESECAEISEVFSFQGWSRPIEQYQNYLLEQTQKLKDVLLLRIEGLFAGYLVICWSSYYEPFRLKGIPEIMDLNVLVRYQRRGVATSLMDEAERRIFEMTDSVGIGVGLTSNYGNAQMMYVRRGYVPDGRGINWNGRKIEPNQTICIDDDVNLAMIKKRPSNIVFNLTYLCVTVLAYATTAPPKTQVKTAFYRPAFAGTARLQHASAIHGAEKLDFCRSFGFLEVWGGC